MDIADIKIGDTLYYNTFGYRGVQTSKICKVLDIRDNKPIVLLKNNTMSFEAFPTKLSVEPKFRVSNIKAEDIEAYKNSSVDKTVLENANYTSDRLERLNKYYSRAQYRDAKRGW